MMKLNDNKIKEIIKEYRVTFSLDSIQQFQEVIYPYIINWPKQQYSCDIDICHDFSLYIIENTQQILSSYPIDTTVQFGTWFNAVLYYKFVDFSKKGEVAFQGLILGEHWENSEYSLIFSDSTEFQQEETIKELLEKLPQEYKNLVLFYYFPHDITAEQLISIALYTEQDLQQILTHYQENLDFQYQTYHDREFLWLKIKEIDRKIAHLENIIQKSQEVSMELNEKIERYKSRQNKYLRTLKRISQKTFKIFTKLFVNYDKAYRTYKKIELLLKKSAHTIYTE